MPKVLRITPIIILSYVLVGTLLYPVWWYEFLFLGGIWQVDYWIGGFQYVAFEIMTHPLMAWLALPILMISALLISRTSAPDNLLDGLKSVWSRYVMGNRWGYILLSLAILALGGILSTPSRFESRLTNFEEFLASVKFDKLRMTRKTLSLQNPSKFLYVNEGIVSSLYGQYEPDLVPVMVIQEFGNSSGLRVGASFRELAEAEIDRTRYERRVLEYRSIQKSPERKAIDLLTYLINETSLTVFEGVESIPEELEEIDEAVEILKRHGIRVPSGKMLAVRGALLAEEIAGLKSDLRNLKGLVLVKGLWTVTESAEAFVFRRPFVENVVASPVCQFSLARALFLPEELTLLEGMTDRELPLIVFGNTLTGITDESQIILLTPIAVY